MKKFILIVLLLCLKQIGYAQDTLYKIDSVLNNSLLINSSDYKEYSKVIVVADDSLRFLAKNLKPGKFIFIKAKDSLSILKILGQHKRKNFLFVEVQFQEKKNSDFISIRFSKSYTSYNMFSGKTYLKIKINPLQKIDLKLHKVEGIWYPNPI